MILRRCCCLLFLVPLLLRAGTTPIPIHFEHVVGERPLRFDTTMYQNEQHQPYAISMVRYYVSAIRLHCEGNEDVTSEKFFLVDASDSTTTTITLPRVPIGTYRSISFTIGVDSAHNCSGPQEGVLDPIRGMFWAWNTGYIFMKVEGTSPVSPSPGHLVEVHIGGFRQPYNNIARIELPIVEDPVRGIYVRVDVGAILQTLDLSSVSSITTPAAAAPITALYPRVFHIIRSTER
ncbi:MAG: hypothetical protein JSS89_06165 [Bacteroidetes bacterium]|nr:hypothetical protein [Bacteroidota bacterium]